jgi:hypothetical protein
VSTVIIDLLFFSLCCRLQYIRSLLGKPFWRKVLSQQITDILKTTAEKEEKDTNNTLKGAIWNADTHIIRTSGVQNARRRKYFCYVQGARGASGYPSA